MAVIVQSAITVGLDFVINGYKTASKSGADPEFLNRGAKRAIERSE